MDARGQRVDEVEEEGDDEGDCVPRRHILEPMGAIAVRERRNYAGVRESVLLFVCPVVQRVGAKLLRRGAVDAVGAVSVRQQTAIAVRS